MFLLSFLLITACSDKKPGRSATSSEAVEKAADKNPENPRPGIRLEEKGDQQITQGERQLKVFYSQSFAKRNVPDDFKIGPLADYHKYAGERSTVLSQVDQFCLSLTNNELKDELLDEQNRALLTESLQYYLKRDIKPTEYRIGLVELSGDGSSHVPVRFLSGRGISEGDIYLVRRAEAWLITDVQVDLQRLEQDYVRSDEEFVPASYDLLFNNTF